MNRTVLVLGGGGREHAIAWKLSQSPLVATVLVAPGNPGTARTPRCENVAVDPCDPVAVSALCDARGVDLVVVGPEAPLVAGVADALRAAGVAVVGPGRDGAELEASKAFAKEIMVAAGVPTARYARCSTPAEVHAFVEAFDGKALVVKADGLAAGKGVVVCDDVRSARDEAVAMLRDRPFGDASATVVLEERLDGIETSYIVLTDGTDFVAMPTSQDHKRLLDGDEGPNTGGMGAFSPAPFVTDAVRDEIEEKVIVPTLAEVRRRGITFRGFLYAGVMLTARGPMVLEFNVRLGDPETQALMLATGDDLVPLLDRAATGSLAGATLRADRASAVVVVAAEGYPASPVRGAVIEGLDTAAAEEAVTVFHAGTALRGDTIVVAGGRVLGVAAHGATPEQAVQRAYAGVAHIAWPGAHARTDIGKALRG
jgi:phosphoribosylamine--glycine ligase